ncbi:MAG: hypothetical protein KI785_07095 [Devosiaceae bacterium]|nr:hypothetical protein [Devosiaceae bacterium MH13]
MMTLTKTMTLTSLAIILAIFTGVWLASTSPASSRTDSFAPSVSVETRLGAAELDLCQGQAWPHFSDGCAAWIAATNNTSGIDRTVSTMVSDVDHGFTIVSKAQPLEVAAR